MITQETTYDLLLELLETHALKDIAAGVGVNMGTAKRWLELHSLPKQYYIELCRFSGKSVDYADLSVVEKDQFFTDPKTAQYCYDKTVEILSSLGYDTQDYVYVEPSAGSGSFYNLLPKDRRLGVDIEPRCGGVIQSDYLLWEPPAGKYITIGNPPFGLRGNLALKFINHSAQFSDFVAFIVPQLFGSDGKGSCKGRVRGLNLIHNEVVSTSFHYPDGKDVEVNVVFQIWAKHESIETEKPNLSGIAEVVSISDGGTPGTTRNKKYHYVCDYFIPSTCFGKNKLVLVSSIDDLPNRKGYGILLEDSSPELVSAIEQINWGEVAFTSTNGAVNLRTDLIEGAIWNAAPETVKHKQIGLEQFFV